LFNAVSIGCGEGVEAGPGSTEYVVVAEDRGEELKDASGEIIDGFGLKVTFLVVFFWASTEFAGWEGMSGVLSVVVVEAIEGQLRVQCSRLKARGILCHEESLKGEWREDNVFGLVVRFKRMTFSAAFLDMVWCPLF
jgi:hypothetical protein